VIKIVKTVLATASITFAVFGCGGGGSGGGNEGNSTTVQTASMQGTTQSTTSSIDSFRFVLDASINLEIGPNYANRITNTVGRAVVALNQIDNLLGGVQVPITFRFCGQANAFYTPGLRTIDLCDELIDAGILQFANGPSDEEILIALDRAIDMMIFVTYHEIGHALDDLSGQSVGGNSESAADAIATVLSVQTGQPLAALWAAAFFSVDTEGSFAAVHGSGVDRAGDIICWTIGSSSRLTAALPAIAQDLVDSGRDCVAEYANQLQFVSTLIPNLSSLPPVDSLSKVAKSDLYKDLQVKLSPIFNLH